MRVTDLRVTNVRPIRTAELRFQAGFNLLVGDNGVGKTTVLEALAVCLAEYVRAYNNQGEPRLPREDMIRLGAASLDVECGFLRGESRYRFVIHKPRGQSAKKPGRIGFVANQPPKDPHIFEVRPYVDAGESEGRPLGVLYSTGRAGASEGWPRTLSRGISRAYEDALSDRQIRLGYFGSWMAVLQTLNVESNRQALEALETAVRRLLPGYSNLHLGGADGRKLLIDRHGETLAVRHLSHGERSILAVVLDLTRRLGTANPGVMDPAGEAGAVVLIDEIDLHLHPNWQRQVASKLTTTFPCCQFIATTHSPQVIGEIGHDRIQVIGDDGAYSPTHSFGVDSSRILEEVMEAEPRNREVKGLLSHASDFIDRERFKEARELLGKLSERLGSNDADVIGLGTLLDFLEGGD